MTKNRTQRQNWEIKKNSSSSEWCKDCCGEGRGGERDGCWLGSLNTENDVDWEERGLRGPR